MTELLFDEPSHTYTKDSVVYRNVSSLVEKYSPPFPKEEAALRVAVSQKTTPEKIIKQWEDNGDVSRVYGSAIDLAVRYWIDHSDIPRPVLLKSCVEEFIDLTWEMKLTANIMLGHDDLEIAGTVDIFDQPQDIDIWDVKTNASLKKGRGKMLGPFSDLPATNLIMYFPRSLMLLLINSPTLQTLLGLVALPQSSSTCLSSALFLSFLSCGR